jgi:hypothetical protein
MKETSHVKAKLKAKTEAKLNLVTIVLHLFSFTSVTPWEQDCPQNKNKGNTVQKPLVEV